MSSATHFASDASSWNIHPGTCFSTRPQNMHGLRMTSGTDFACCARRSARTAGRWRCTTAAMARAWDSSGPSFDLTVTGEVATSVGDGACSGSTAWRLYGGGDGSGLETVRSARWIHPMQGTYVAACSMRLLGWAPQLAQMLSSLPAGRIWSSTRAPGSRPTSPSL